MSGTRGQRDSCHVSYGAQAIGAKAAPAGRRLIALGLAVLLGAAVTMAASGEADAAEAPVGLGTATSFVVLGGSTVTNTGPSVISGDLGVSPGSAVTGFPPGLVNNGTIHGADAVADQAQNDLTTAYNDAAGRSMSAAVTADLGGQTLVAGVYRGPTLGLTGTVVLDAQGDPNAVFIFQAASTLITASTSTVAMINGADPCNVFWQVGSSATLGTNSVFRGTVMALTAITATTGATIQGRLLARNAAVTLDSNVITTPTCAAAVVPTTTTSTTATTGGTTTTVPGSPTTTAPAGTPTTVANGSTTTTTAPTGTPTTVANGSTTTTAPTGASTTVPSGPTTTVVATGSTGSTGSTGTTSSTSSGITATTAAGTTAAGTTAGTISGGPRTTSATERVSTGGGGATRTGVPTLAFTGANVVAMILAGLVALALGIVMVFASRRRSEAAPVR